MKHMLMILPVLLLIGCLKTRSEIKDRGTGHMRTDASGSYVSGSMGQQQRAQIDSRFFEIDRDFRELYGKIETLERKLDDTSSQPAVQPESQATASKMTQLEKRISTLEEALLAIDKKVNLSSKSKSARNGASSSRQKPKGPFGKGELHFESGEYEKAIAEYDTYRKRYPRGRRYAQATLQMGRCFEKLRMKNDAKAFYKEVIQRYPKTRVALTAEANLKKL